MQTFQDAE